MTPETPPTPMLDAAASEREALRLCGWCAWFMSHPTGSDWAGHVLEALEQALQLHAHCIYAHVIGGITMLLAGDLSMAMLHFGIARFIDPHHEAMAPIKKLIHTLQRNGHFQVSVKLPWVILTFKPRKSRATVIRFSMQEPLAAFLPEKLPDAPFSEDRLHDAVPTGEAAPPPSMTHGSAGATALSQEDVLVHLLEGHRAAVRRAYAIAERYYNRILEADPQSIQALLGRSFVRTFSGDCQGAIEDAAAVIALDPQNWMAFFDRGQALVRAGRFAEAMVDYRRAAELEPQNDDVKFAMLEAEVCNGQYREATARAGAVWAESAAVKIKLRAALCGGIAMIILGKSPVKWQRYADYLETGSDVNGFDTFDIEQALLQLPSDEVFVARRQQAQALMALFKSKQAEQPLAEEDTKNDES